MEPRMTYHTRSSTDLDHLLEELDGDKTSPSSTPSHRVPLSLGLGYGTSDVADAVLTWGGPGSFYLAVEKIATAESAYKQWKHVTRSKATAPYAIWACFRPGSTGRSYGDVVARTAVVFDIDGGNIDPDSLHDAIYDLGWEAACYSTWRATSEDLRWRVVIPLSAPISASEYPKFYAAIRNKFVKALRTYCDHDLGEELDDSAKRAGQPQILPHSLLDAELAKSLQISDARFSKICESLANDVDGAVGSQAPIMFGVAGRAIPVGTPWAGERRTLSLARFAQRSSTNRTARSREDFRELAGKKGGTSSKKGCQELATQSVYVGDASSERAKNCHKLWQAEGLGYIAELAEGLDGAAYLAQHGVHVRNGSESRWMLLHSAMWAMHRAGATTDAAAGMVDSAIAASKPKDQAYLGRKATELVGQLAKDARTAKPIEVQIMAALTKNLPDDQVLNRGVKQRFAAILARAKHIRGMEGKLRQSQISEVLGLPGQAGYRAVRAMLQACADAGILSIEGQDFERTYRVNLGGK